MGIIQKIHTSIQDDFRDEVVEILTRRSEGMFLWLSLALNSLEDSAIWDINAIKERLQSIPFDVQAIYGKLFEAADPKMRTLLGWVFLAGRPLKIDEALTIFALENKPKSVKDMKKNIMSPVSLRGSIGGPMKAFLTLQEDDTICAAHPSVKEFIDDILNNQQQQSQKLVTGIVRVGVHKQMAAACVAYLNLEEVQALSVPKPPVDNNGMIDKKKLEKEVEKYLEKYQFLDYSIRYLGLHLRESGKDEIKDSAQGIDNLFDKNSSALRNWVQGYDLLVRCTQGKYTGSSSGLSTLFIAARLNLTSLAEHSISSSGLQTALASGFSLPGLKSLAGGIASVSMVREQMLNLPDLKGWCALHVAADSEAEEVLCWLLEKGASVDSITKGFIRPGRTALHFASSKPSDVGSRMVEALIKKGANVRQPTTLGGNTPLHYAVQSGSVDTVKLLLRKPASKSLGADPNAANYSGITALHKAVAIPGLEEIVETLLGNNTTDPEKTTAIDKVGFAREVKSAKLTTVLKTVATSNPTSMLKAATDAVRGVAMNQSALHIAVGCKGTEETTKKLLDWYHRNEQKPTSKDSMGYTALHSAASGVGCATHLKLLIDSKKLDVNALDNNGGTPLILYMKNVSQRRKELGELEPLKEALDMLLSAGADTRIKDKDGKTAMDFAELAGLEWAVQRLKTAAGIPTTPDSSSPVESPVSSPKKPKTGRFGFRFG
ncbi:uncharacterized protein DFL_003861 [Arthrobotrys flagrans]|uniref:Uncharacterized protein n=1 Tax=Arthrobotrys flagrans TaxID=97331 RepID=A0A437A337_ARTFL|nr:hypothetical protein DFL_003861 [Arthrobotrys flagrans]